MVVIFKKGFYKIIYFRLSENCTINFHYKLNHTCVISENKMMRHWLLCFYKKIG